MKVDTLSPWPSFTQEESDAVQKVLLSNKVNYWTGDEGKSFETEFAEWTGTKHAIALANGTAALELALKALEIGDGDEVVVTPRSFIASASCVVNVGATPVFADVDKNSANITAESIRAVLTSRTKAVIPVHLAGWPCDMDPIMEIAKAEGLFVIEDCAQAHGAIYKGRSVGSIGHVGAWSFCQDKIMTTGGEGGMVTCNDSELWSRMWSYKDHGKSWQAVHEKEHPPGFRWQHESFGTNWRMTEMQAAIGRIQIRRMRDWTAERNANAQALYKALVPFSLEDGPIRLPKPLEPNSTHAQYKFYAYVRPKNLASDWTRDRIMQEVNDRGVPCFQGSCPEIYMERAFERAGLRPSTRLPIAKALGETSIVLLVHPGLTKSNIDQSCSVLGEVLSQAAK